MWLFNLFCFPQFCKSDMSRYGNLEVFQRVPWFEITRVDSSSTLFLPVILRNRFHNSRLIIVTFLQVIFFTLVKVYRIYSMYTGDLTPHHTSTKIWTFWILYTLVLLMCVKLLFSWQTVQTIFRRHYLCFDLGQCCLLRPACPYT